MIKEMSKIIYFLMVFSASVMAKKLCGVATNMFQEVPYAIINGANAGMDFWWNWNHKPTATFPDGTVAKWKYSSAEFIPMIWGPQSLTDELKTDLRKGTFVMGFNEPDLYGPPSNGNPATSCGAWTPCFSPTNAAANWKKFIDGVFPEKDFTNGPKILSPSMANGPSGNGAQCNSGSPNVIVRCEGWLVEFKKQAQALQLTKSNGETSNYWDIIDYIQIHGYDYDAAPIINNIKNYATTFQDDIAKGKLIWLTEVAGGYLNMDEQMNFMKSIISQLNAMPEIYGYSWFSEPSFPSFVIDNRQPTDFDWASNLFGTNGELNDLGKLYFQLCSEDITIDNSTTDSSSNSQDYQTSQTPKEKFIAIGIPLIVLAVVFLLATIIYAAFKIRKKSKRTIPTQELSLLESADYRPVAL